jgi:hypothetical protein
MRISVEAPWKKTTIVQCTRCQSYGHNKTYCAQSPVCVKCGGDHATTVCTKDPTAPATCALCGGAHPANYKGCDVYRRLQTARGAPDRSLASLAHPPSPSIPLTYTTSLPCRPLSPLCNNLHPLPPCSPTSSPPAPSLLISQCSSPPSSMSSNPYSPNLCNRQARSSPCSLLSSLASQPNGRLPTRRSLER